MTAKAADDGMALRQRITASGEGGGLRWRIDLDHRGDPELGSMELTATIAPCSWADGHSTVSGNAERLAGLVREFLLRVAGK